MNITFLLRFVGWLPSVADEQYARASTENALHDNERAFEAMHQAYSKVPETNARFREIIHKSRTPFADLERMMRREEKKH